jgi:hypothetical protein
MDKEKSVITNSDNVETKKSKTRTKQKTLDMLTDQQKKSCMKFVGHYLELFPITGSNLLARETKQIEKNLSWKDLTFESMRGKVMTLVGKNDAVKSCFFYILKKLPFLSTARYISLFDILDVQFGKHPKYTSIRDIRAPIILIYVENVTNRLKDEYLLRAVDFWCKKGSTVWIYFKGCSAEWVTHFAKTKDFAMSNKFISIDLNATPTATSSVITKQQSDQSLSEQTAQKTKKQ